MNGNSIEITSRELEDLAPGSFLLIDLRDQTAYDHGCIPGALNMDPDALMAGECSLPADKKIVLYCKYGIISEEAALFLREKGLDACHLAQGYGRWALEAIQKEAEDEKKRDAIEKSLTKKFRRDIFSRFTKAIVQYEMLSPGDKVAVCISGGKDSMLMAKLFQELLKHDKFPFELVFLCMDPGYSEDNRRIIENNGKLLGIPLTIFETDIFSSVYNIENSPCYLCARMRRGHLYAKARELGCNKIALGHHYDDVIETVLMGMLYSGQFQAMMPKLRSTNFEGMELIRPLYFVREEDIKHWRDYNGLHFIQCACRFTDTCTTCRATGESASKRLETKTLIARLKETNPQVEKNILKATENVVLNKVLGYKKDGVRRSFLEDY
ncbi:MAG: ATPase [Lachnospiraceae bacterium]|nr:ATPase [Lachnospiraceae bacterium]